MSDIEEKIYGIPVVPYYDENRIMYGGFEGIVISCSPYNYDTIEILKMVKDDGKYMAESWMRIAPREVLEHSQTTGKEKAQFLYSKAKNFSKGNENIAISSSLVPNLKLLDYNYESQQKVLKQRCK